MNLPLADPFTPPYEAWDERAPTLDEMIAAGTHLFSVRTQLKARISDAYEAACYIAAVGADNAFGDFVSDALDKSAEYAQWQKAMPRATPPALSRYQQRYPHYDLAEAIQAIDAAGRLLSDGQRLFHGGLWNGPDRFVSQRPFSTSLCPQVALRNAEHRGKAYDSGRIDLMVLNVSQPRTKAFVFKRKGTNLGHENEVLFAASATLQLRSRNLIRADYLVGTYGFPDKRIPIYVLEVDIS